MRHVYSLLLHLLTPLVLLRLLWRSLRAPDYRRRIGERFGRLPVFTNYGGIWIHAVSVGEVQASAPLIQSLLLEYPNFSLIITTTTPTGSRRLIELFGSKVHHFYTPYDLPLIVRHFLNTVRPRLAIFMETEIWPNILYQCQIRNIPTLLANARLSEKSARGYAKFNSLTRETFGRFTHIAAQSQADAQRFIALGVPLNKLTITGSIKFDVGTDPSLYEHAAVIKRLLGEDRPIWIAASTHEGEDELILSAHQQILANLPTALLILVPRHPERFSKVGSLVLKQGLSMVRRSENRTCTTDTKVFLGDSMGELLMFFAAADVAFVGGSLVPHGGHNLLEPAALGIPVVTGPHLTNFAHVAEILFTAAAAKQVTSAAELANVLQTWLMDDAARTCVGERGRLVVEQNRGALAKLLKVIKSTLRP